MKTVKDLKAFLINIPDDESLQIWGNPDDNGHGFIMAGNSEFNNLD